MQLARVVLLLIVFVTPSFAAPTQLQKDRIAAAEKVFKGVTNQLAVGRVTIDAVYAWSVRWLDASIDAEPAKAKDAFAAHLERMKALEAERIKARDAGTAPTYEADAAAYFRLEAELWLARKRNRDRF